MEMTDIHEGEEETPLNNGTAVKVHLKENFNNVGIESCVAIESDRVCDNDTSFSNLGKEELSQYANDPFWKKIRMILLIGFWIGWVTMLVVAIVITVLAQKCPRKPDQKWYEKETVYEILPESFQDTSSKAYNGAAKKGDGVGDIKGENDFDIKLHSFQLPSYIST